MKSHHGKCAKTPNLTIVKPGCTLCTGWRSHAIYNSMQESILFSKDPKYYIYNCAHAIVIKYESKYYAFISSNADAKMQVQNGCKAITKVTQ